MREVLVKESLFKLLTILTVLLIGLSFLFSALFFFRISQEILNENQEELSSKIPHVDLQSYEQVIKKYQ